jgi:hypothetical protein
MNVEKFRLEVRRWGLTRTIFSHIMRRVSRYLGIHVYVVRGTEMKAEPKYPLIPSNISLRVIPADEVPEVTENPALMLGREFVQGALNRGDLLIGAFDGPRLVSYVWRTFTAAPHTDKLMVMVNKPYCYAYNSFTLPDYRGQRIAPAVHILSDVEMFKRGYSDRAGFVDIANSASLAMGKHMGTAAIGYAGYLEWFGRLIPFRTPAIKSIGFKFFERD